jgi:putative endonuclease
VLYIGVTNNLIRRVYEHREELVDGFTKKYKVKKLMYYEMFQYVEFAIQREKTLKHWKRERKINLIEATNPHWEDLWCSINS